MLDELAGWELLPPWRWPTRLRGRQQPRGVLQDLEELIAARTSFERALTIDEAADGLTKHAMTYVVIRT